MDLIFKGLLIGLAATIAIDIWAILLNRTLGLPTPNWAMVGRWVGNLPSGRVMHDDMGQAAPVANELALGWAFHFAVGALFGVVTALIGGAAWFKAPTLFLPLAVGIITVGCGWFILQPAMGAGIAASKKPDAMRSRFLNIVAHVIFGLAMYGMALVLR